MNIIATTKLYGIFGHPVKQSLSPVMHNAAFSNLNIDCVYIAFDIQPDDLGSATTAIRTLGIRGINVTIPHKEKIISFLDGTSPEATLTGAVNTIANDNGKLTGYNTDVGGFLRAIKDDLQVNPKGLRVFVLGAGGAARAVVTALCMNEASEIYIVNRTFEKAKNLASEFETHFKKISISGFSLDDLQAVENSLKSTDLLVNATSSGMEGIYTIDLNLKTLPEKSKIYDLVYKPRETMLIKRSKQLGLRAAGGLSMLLYQGVKSFEIWTGEKAPVEVMRKSIE